MYKYLIFILLSFEIHSMNFLRRSLFRQFNQTKIQLGYLHKFSNFNYLSDNFQKNKAIYSAQFINDNNSEYSKRNFRFSKTALGLIGLGTSTCVYDFLQEKEDKEIAQKQQQDLLNFISSVKPPDNISSSEYQNFLLIQLIVDLIYVIEGNSMYLAQSEKVKNPNCTEVIFTEDDFLCRWYIEISSNWGVLRSTVNKENSFLNIKNNFLKNVTIGNQSIFYSNNSTPMYPIYDDEMKNHSYEIVSIYNLNFINYKLVDNNLNEKNERERREIWNSVNTYFQANHANQLKELSRKLIKI